MCHIKGERVPISFTVDGTPFTVDDKHQTAAAILRLAGLDPSLFDLARARVTQDDPHPFRDDQQVIVKSGEAFVSVRQSAQVA